MPFVPFENLALRSNLPPEETAKRLKKIVGRNKEYSGDVLTDSFFLRRNITNKNSFLPMVSGTIAPDGHGSLIRVRMKLHPFISVFCVVWCTIALWTGLSWLPGLMQGNWQKGAPWLMLLFMYIMCTTAFSGESRRVKTDLRRELEAEIVRAVA
jgi:hypothetical protein